MHFGDWSDFDFAFRETADGYAITIKGDKHKLKPKVEAIEAYVNFRRKVNAAGVGKGVHAHFHGYQHGHRTMPGKLLHKLHRHFGAARHVIGNIRRYGMEHGHGPNYVEADMDEQQTFESNVGMGHRHGRRRGFKQRSGETAQHNCGCGK